MVTVWLSTISKLTLSFRILGIPIFRYHMASIRSHHQHGRDSLRHVFNDEEHEKEASSVSSFPPIMSPIENESSVH